MKSSLVYFDHNATSPLLPEAEIAWKEASSLFWANPSALYGVARQSHLALESKREALGGRWGVRPGQLIFTSGATEGIFSVFAAEAKRSQGKWVAYSVLEHAAVKAAAHRFFPGKCIELLVDANGVLDLNYMKDAFHRYSIAMVAVMAASNELGTLQPWQEVCLLAKEHRATSLVDAVQWVGRLPVADLKLADWVVASGHKSGGPKGIGLLKVPEYWTEPLIFEGGGQEHGLRSGTENLPSLLAMLAAWDVLEEQSSAVDVQKTLRDAFEVKIKKNIPGILVLGEGVPRLWNTSALWVPQHLSRRWVQRLDRLGIAVGMGAACSSAGGSASAPKALQLPDAHEEKLLRISSGHFTRAEDWDYLADSLKIVAEDLAFVGNGN